MMRKLRFRIVVRAGGKLALAIGLHFLQTIIMVRSISVDEKKRGRGRPRTGEQPALSARVPKEVLARVDQWAAANDYTRSEAVAMLL